MGNALDEVLSKLSELTKGKAEQSPVHGAAAVSGGAAELSEDVASDAAAVSF